MQQKDRLHDSNLPLCRWGKHVCYMLLVNRCPLYVQRDGILPRCGFFCLNPLCSGITSGITYTLSESDWDITHSSVQIGEGGLTAQTQAHFNYSYTRANGKMEEEQRNPTVGERSQQPSECATSAFNYRCSNWFKENADDVFFKKAITECSLFFFLSNYHFTSGNGSYGIIIVLSERVWVYTASTFFHQVKQCGWANHGYIPANCLPQAKEASSEYQNVSFFPPKK